MAHPRRSPLFWPLSPYSSEKDIFILEVLLVNRHLTLYTNNSNFLNWHKLSERTQGQVSKKMILKHTYMTAHPASLEFAQVHVPWVGDVIQPSHPLSPPFPPAFNLSQHQGLFQWVISSHQVAKVLELQLQHQSLQWIFREAWHAVVHGVAKSRTHVAAEQQQHVTACRGPPIPGISQLGTTDSQRKAPCLYLYWWEFWVCSCSRSLPVRCSWVQPV